MLYDIAMFDICKNNQRVAQLHLTKTSYRLGEAVLGVLDFEHAVLPTYEVSDKCLTHTYNPMTPATHSAIGVHSFGKQ